MLYSLWSGWDTERSRKQERLVRHRGEGDQVGHRLTRTNNIVLKR